MNTHTFVGTALTAAGVLTGIPVLACSIASYDPLTIDGTSEDIVPPSAPALVLEQIKRGTAPPCPEGAIGSAGECDDLGWIRLSLAATDDETPSEQLGYILRIDPDDPALGPLQGTYGVEWYNRPLRTIAGEMMLVWTDGALYVQEPIDVTFQVHAVDAAGNESEEFTIPASRAPGRRTRRLHRGGRRHRCDARQRSDGRQFRRRGLFSAV